MMTINDFRKELENHSPCRDGSIALERCRTRKDVFDLIASPVAADYFLASIQQGWGPEPEDFESVFRPYINGRHTVINKLGDGRKVRSQVWCMADDVETDDSVRWLVLIGCRGQVTVRNWQVVKIFMDRNCRVTINCAPGSVVYVENYGGDIRSVEGECKITRK